MPVDTEKLPGILILKQMGLTQAHLFFIPDANQADPVAVVYNLASQPDGYQQSESPLTGDGRSG